jgi:DNA invertase Pin-like site-specific DNA recombinase
MMLIGYMRVSKSDGSQSLDLQRDKARHGFLYIFAESSRLYLRNCSSTSM